MWANHTLLVRCLNRRRVQVHLISDPLQIICSGLSKPRAARTGKEPGALQRGFPLTFAVQAHGLGNLPRKARCRTAMPAARRLRASAVRRKASGYQHPARATRGHGCHRHRLPLSPGAGSQPSRWLHGSLGTGVQGEFVLLSGAATRTDAPMRQASPPRAEAAAGARQSTAQAAPPGTPARAGPGPQLALAIPLPRVTQPSRRGSVMTLLCQTSAASAGISQRMTNEHNTSH